MDHFEELAISALCTGMPGLSVSLAEVLCEAAAICLEHNQHSSGACLHLSGTDRSKKKLVWTAATEQQKRTHADIHEATEWGACGIAISVIRKLTGLVVVERSAKGTGFDYWIGMENEDALPFQENQRLEVSGILHGSPSQIALRVRQKKAQMTPSDNLAVGLVAVVEFGRPQAHVETK